MRWHREFSKENNLGFDRVDVENNLVSVFPGEHPHSQVNIGRRASSRLGITESDKPRRKRPYKNKNRLNGLPLYVLRVLSESPDDPFSKAVIQAKTGFGEWGTLRRCLARLIKHDCVEYTPKNESTTGQDVYKVKRFGRDVISTYDRSDPIANTIRDLLKVEEPGTKT